MAAGGPPVSSFHFSHKFAAENPAAIDDVYKIDKKALGEGSYGQVFKATAKGDKGSNVYAVKKMKKMTDQKKLQKLHEEVQIQNSLDHPNIAKLYESFQDGNYYYLVMEMCTGGELFDKIIDAAENSGQEGVAFSENMVATYMNQILGAFHYMHSNHYVHRDIKPENFLMQSKDKNAEIKVIDFGLAKYNKDGAPMKTKAGTPYYVAPQVLQGSYDHKCDIWSCGVIAYILTCGYPPFYGDTDNDILKMVKKGQFDFPQEDWKDRSKALKDFITSMLTLDPAKRPEAADLLKDIWLNAEKKADEVRPLDAKAFTNLKTFHQSSRLKKLALTMIAQEVNVTQIQDLKQTFKGLDTDNDGMVSQEEIVQAIEELKKKGNHSFDVDALHQYLSKLDTDGSGKIDWSEFVASMMDKRTYETEAGLWKAFQKLDLDHDGFITKSELKTVLSGASGEVAESELKDIADQVDRIMKESDTNGDDKISFAEFKDTVNL